MCFAGIISIIMAVSGGGAREEDLWSEEAESCLIDLWRNEMCLYDTTSKEYSNRQLRQKKVEEFAVILGKSDIEIKKHINSLRTQFMRYRKSLPSGSAARKRTARQQWVLERCDWLTPYIKQRASQSTLDLSDLGLEADHDDDVSNMSEENDVKTKKSSTKPTKRERDNEELNLIRNLTTILESPSNVSEETDADLLFGQYVTSELKQIQNKKTKAVLMNKIQNDIFEVKIKDLD
ncbi:uncharacterized protein [Antedon mediterranea]|uniref:uncharacterized protein n=1 Tax=Antedon mediterranea TaxID=105859 RepID=UPI003AF4F63A